MNMISIPAIAVSILLTLTAGTPRTLAARDGESAAGVKPGSGRAHVREALLRKRVRSQLVKHIKSPDALRINITAQGQTVTLTGEVEKQASLKLAGTLARSAEGVRRVNNKLTIATPVVSNVVVVKTATAGSSCGTRTPLRANRVKTKPVVQAGMPALKLDTAAGESAVAKSGGAPEFVQPGTAPSIIPVTATPATREGKSVLGEIAFASGDVVVTPE